MQRRIERAVLYLQHVVGLMLDDVRDGVAVRGPANERLEDEQIERALQQFTLQRLVPLFRHASRLYHKIIYGKNIAAWA